MDNWRIVYKNRHHQNPPATPAAQPANAAASKAGSIDRSLRQREQLASYQADRATSPK